MLAGPGSAKTKVLVAKVARLLGEARGPRGVASITYNNECVRGLKQRPSTLGLRPGRGLYIGTVHSFCLSAVIAPFGHLFREDLEGGLQVAGGAQQRNLLEHAIAEEGLGRPDADLVGEINRYRRTHPLRDEHWRENADFARVIERYEAALIEEGLIDFDGMILAS